MKNCITVSLFILTLLLAASPAPAKTFYLSDGSTIQYLKVWKKGDRIFLLVNRDTLLEFLPEEVDKKRTLRAAGLKKFPTHSMKKRKKPVSTSSRRSISARPAEPEEQPFSGYDRANASETSAPGQADKGSGIPAAATVHDRYADLVQVMHCPRDQGSYGEFRDYGWWGGGPWCGQTGKAGYWVWVAPNWYVWAGRK